MESPHHLDLWQHSPSAREKSDVAWRACHHADSYRVTSLFYFLNPFLYPYPHTNIWFSQAVGNAKRSL
ncbi:hypothetical protein [Acinetobacter faecalis]|uniref:hypothetical protein n=1 Tax=Acinetobacter faecalis TaxID=2665161 RepID=UPI001D185A3C|nr:hypothetical protein [Acinetobacter faecalis]